MNDQILHSAAVVFQNQDHLTVKTIVVFSFGGLIVVIHIS